MKRILFVDDERLVLDGLSRMLFELSGDWDMEFANGGEEALSAMSAAPFDVVVSDMRMPGMDGATLLTHVQKQHPGTVRIILSGHTEVEVALRAVPVAHQFLSKPCQSQVIQEVVSRACALRDLLADDKLKSVIGGVKTLPALPRVYNQLVGALADPDVSLDEVAAIVEQDAAIAAKILQLVNSSFFGLPRTVGDIRQATSYLGTNMLRNLALSMEVFRAFEEGELPAGFSLEREQAHASLTARIARNLIEDRIMRESAFVAAMLHDIGKLIHATTLPESYEVAARAATDGKPFHEAELAATGVSHGELGAFLLGIWGMPYDIVEAVAHHHQPARVPHENFDVLGAVHVANGIAHELENPNAECDRIDIDYLASVGVADKLPSWKETATENAAKEKEAA